MFEYYFLVKTVHIVAVISWMAGMLYLPRLFVYHVGAKIGGELDVTLQKMEHRLLRYIMNPAMFVVVISGGILVYILGKNGLGLWFHWKMLFIIFMFGVHGLLAKYKGCFRRGENKHTERFYRIINEVPTVLMVLIVLLVVFKPQ